MFLSYFRAALRLFPDVVFDYIMIFAKRKRVFFRHFASLYDFNKTVLVYPGFLSPRNAICIVKRNKKQGESLPLSGLIRPAYTISK